MLAGRGLDEQDRGGGDCQIRQGMAAWRAMRARVGQSHFFATAGQSGRGKWERTEEGLSVLTEALATNKQKN